MATLKLGFVPILKSKRIVVEIPKKEKAIPKSHAREEAEKMFKKPVTNGNQLKKPYKFRYSKEQYQKIIDLYPDLLNKATPIPLKVGIHTELMEAHPDIGRKLIREFLKYWVTREEYLQSLVIGCERMDLKHSHVGEITQAHKDRAQAQLKKRKKKWEKDSILKIWGKK